MAGGDIEGEGAKKSEDRLVFAAGGGEDERGGFGKTDGVSAVVVGIIAWCERECSASSSAQAGPYLEAQLHPPFGIRLLDCT